MISMKQSLGKLILAGTITEEEALSVAPSVKEAEVRARDPFAFTETARGKYTSVTNPGNRMI